MNLRSTPLIGDINRKYELVDGKINKVNGEINKVNGQTNGINKQIIEIIKMNKIDFVLDFHEGYDFHKINESSLGTTITYTNDKTGKAEEIGEKIIRIKIDNNHLTVGYESGMLRTIELNNYEIVFESKEEGMVLDVMVLDVIIGG